MSDSLQRSRADFQEFQQWLLLLAALASCGSQDVREAEVQLGLADTICKSVRLRRCGDL